MFDALTLESGWPGCAVSVFCLMLFPASVSETWLSEAAWLAQLDPVGFCFGLLSSAFGLFLQYFLCHQVSWEGSSIFCGLHFMRVVDIDGLFCDGNWCRFKNFKTACDVTRYMIM